MLPRRVPAAGAALLAVLGGLLVAPAGPAAATDAQITITSPAANSQVSGLVTVTATITARPGYEPRAATLSVAGGPWTRVEIPAGSCVVSCEVSATIDSRTNGDPGPHPAQPDETVLDGPSDVVVTVEDRYGTCCPFASVPVIVDNDRPTITAPEEPQPAYPGGPWTLIGLTANDALRVVLDPQVPPDSTATIDHVDVHFHDGDKYFPPATLTPPPPGQPWVYTADTAQVPQGDWIGHAIAYDTRGVPSGTLKFSFVVDHGPTVTLGALPPLFRTDGSPALVPVTASVYRWLPTTWLAGYAVLIDGVINLDRLQGGQLTTPASSFSAYVGDKPLPAGRHTLTVRVIDNRGVYTDVSRDILVDPGPAVEWLSDAGQDLPVGSTATIAARLTAIPDQRVASWRIEVDGTVIAASPAYADPADMPAATTATGRFTVPDTPGSHQVTVIATTWNGGGTSRATGSVTGYPTVPAAPGSVTAVAWAGTAVVTWAPAAANGSPITGYTVTATPGGRTITLDETWAEATFTELTNGTPYTFTVTATNAVGTGPASTPTTPVTPAAVPTAPQTVTAVAGNHSAVVSWTSGAGNGAPITGYTVTTWPGGKDVTVAASARTTTVTGLANGATYTFTVTATNAVGTGQASDPSAPVVPTDPVKPTVTLTGKPAAASNHTSASFAFTGTDDTDPTSTLTYLCSLDGAAYAPCASPQSYTDLSHAVHTFAVKAVDPSGNQSAAGTHTWWVDTIAPTLAMTAPTAAFTLAGSLTPAWSARDVGAGVASVDVRWQRAAYTGGFGAWVYPAGWQKIPATKATLAAARGYTYCFAARARDKAGNTSGWSAPRCAAAALDDRSLAASAGWARTTASGYYAGTATGTTRSGATLTRTGVQTRRVALVATRCARCGTVGIYWNGTLLKKVSLYAATTRRRSVLAVFTFGGLRSGTLTVRSLTSGRPIQIDGLGLSRT